MANSTLVPDYLGYGTHAARPAAPPISTTCLGIYAESDNGNGIYWYDWLTAAWVAFSAGGSALIVTDGITTVNPVSEINFTSGATVTDAGGGVADVAISGGGGGGATYTPPTTSTFTWVNQPSGATQANVTGALQVFSPSQSGSRNMALLTEAAPGTPYTQWARVSLSPNPSNFYEAGIALADVSGKIVHFCLQTSSGFGVEVDYYTNPTTFSSAPFVVGQIYWPPLIGVNDDGTNLNFLVSYDGVSYFTVYSASRTAFLAAGPTLIGLGVDAFSQPVTMNVAHWASTLPGPI